MARSRFTVTDLREGVDEFNGYLRECGSNVRLITGGRYGYQAVDEIEIVIRDGEEINVTGLNQDRIDAGESSSGCMRNVGTGTSRECYQAADRRYRSAYDAVQRDKAQAQEQELKRLRQENNELKAAVRLDAHKNLLANHKTQKKK